MKENASMDMTEEDQLNYDNCEYCHICNERFGSKEYMKCRDHDHRTGKLRGAAHQSVI